ncbi:hypothetical protein L195_g002552 [Trifolium pratense]|uniref:Uncharacterized protein n=2 Tax=Trifolium pratense TaxID=57577 RepID=A0ACB0IHU8_TRIPR|nr:hypothetical protein L195_g002552 [Trifolium pratense]CAJ2631859.1 unnamed protein product [Trifolium pratense]
MSFFTSNSSFLFLLFSISLFFLSTNSKTLHLHSLHVPDSVEVDGERNHDEVLPWKTRRSMAEDVVLPNTSLILAQEQTTRKDPLDHYNIYNGGWNISNQHYIASVVFTAVPLFIVAAIWFVIFGLTLCFICLCYCCCRREPRGYSRLAYSLSLIFLILFTSAAIAGCIVLYNAQGKFHESTSKTLKYVVSQADFTAENLRNVSNYLDAAKNIGVDAIVLPDDVQKNIDTIKIKIKSSAVELSTKAHENADHIQDGLDGMRLALVIITAVMLFVSFLGFLFLIFGLQGLVYFLIFFGWFLVAGTFILCGVFLFLHNVVADTCVAMDEWVQNPTAHTALDEILPCVDTATAQQTVIQSRDVTRQLVMLVDKVITDVANKNVPAQAGQPVYYNQSGPLMPVLCNPYNPDLTIRTCGSGEVALDNATEVWKSYTCELSPAGFCKTPGRMTPAIASQMEAAVNVSYALYHYVPFLVELQDCTFVRETFTDVSNKYCPGLRNNSRSIYDGLVVASVGVMLSLILWIIYARERRHRVYAKIIHC